MKVFTRLLSSIAKNEGQAVTKVVAVDAISGIPAEQICNRTVRIYKPARTAMQSGIRQTKLWKLDFDVLEKWENPMMGWTTSADPLQAMQIKFESKEDAIAYCQRQGWKFMVDDPQLPSMKKKSYADNFSFSKGELKMIHTK